MKTISTDLLRQLFEYRDGDLYNKVDRHTAKAGEIAGVIRKNGYRHIKISGRHYYAHRLVFMMHHGYMPEMIDHADGNRGNNRIENLRQADYSKNGMNGVTPKNNTTGCKNVYLHKPSGKHQVLLTVNKKLKSFGYYKDFELAELVAVEARNKHYKQFARHA